MTDDDLDEQDDLAPPPELIEFAESVAASVNKALESGNVDHHGVGQLLMTQAIWHVMLAAAHEGEDSTLQAIETFTETLGVVSRSVDRAGEEHDQQAPEGQPQPN